MTTGELISRTLRDCGEAAGSPVFYQRHEVLDALNEAQRLFCLATLCLEADASLNLAANTSFYYLIPNFPKFLVPLRVTVANTGAKVRPASLGSFDSLSETWLTDAGDPKYYDVVGADLLAITPRPETTGTTLTIHYASAPDPLVADADVPQIPEEHHPTLVEYAVARLRAKEGGQEFLKAAPRFGNFLRGAARMAEAVRKRTGGRYDRQPFEFTEWLRRYDAGKPANP